jgi:L-lactate dehydrogenase (cytochrome)
VRGAAQPLAHAGVPQHYADGHLEGTAMAPRLPVHRYINIEDLRRAARRRLPRVVFDYIDGGAEGEVTLRANVRAFEEVTFRPRSAVATPSCDLRTTVLGHPVSMPLLLAPVGSARLFHPRGEEVAAREAGLAGTIMMLSTLSGSRLEDVRAASRAPVFYQLYLVGGRDVALAAIERARTAGFAALVVTIDTPVAGLRERDLRNGMKQLTVGSLIGKLPFLAQFAAHPRWLAAFLRDGGLMCFPNVMLANGPMPYADVGAALEQSMTSWSDLAWIRDAWRGPIVVKGIHTREDALRAVEHGAEAVVVSNHGGRQLDGVRPTLQVLPEVVDAVGGKTEILLDGGVRRGADIARALCLGARAVLIGRAYAWALAAAGGAGVARALDILRQDLIRTMQLLGCGSVADLDASYVDTPAAWTARSETTAGF